MNQENNPPYVTSNLKTQLIFLTLAPMLFSALVLAILNTFLEHKDLQNNLQAQGEIILTYYQSLSENIHVNEKQQALKKLSEELSQNALLRSVHLYSINQNLSKETIIERGPRMKVKEEKTFLKKFFSRIQHFQGELKLSSNIKSKINNSADETIFLEFEMDRSIILIKQSEALILFWFANIICLVLSFIFAYLVAVRFSEPIRSIAFAIARIREGRLSTRVKNRIYQGELNELAWGINSMAESLQLAQEEMQSSVDQATQDLRNTLETIEIQNIQLEMSRKEAENANHIKSKFLANISHEIRTPLNSIMGFSNLLLKSDLDSKQIDYAQTIYQSSQNLLTIINDILDFSKIEAGKLNLDIDELNIRSLIEETCEALSPLARERELEQHIQIDDSVPELILSDALRVKQILINLINNAIKFSEKSALLIRVSTEKAKAEQSLIKCSVSDEGIGLSETAKNKLFEAFHQSDSSNVRRFEGTGLGLTISRHLVELLGGEIGVESKLGQGSTFWFTLPITAIENDSAASSKKEASNTELEVLAIEKETANQSPSQSINLVNKNIQKPKILAVDDNAANLKLLSALLEDLEIDFDTCNNGHTAIHLNESNEYDCIFMDIQMPDLDGIMTTQKIREFDKRFSKSKAIIALTAHALDNEKNSLLKQGFNACLTKPINNDLLMSALEHWAGYNRTSDKISKISNKNNKIRKNLKYLSVINPEEGIRLAGNKPELANELLTMLMHSLAQDWQTIKNAVNENNTLSLLEKVHYLHGACSYCGVPLLREALSDIENKLKRNKALQTEDPALNLMIDLKDDLSNELKNLEKRVMELQAVYQSFDKPIY